MKVLYLHQYFATPDMSGGTRSYEMARRLVRSGHEVHIVTSWRESINSSDWFEGAAMDRAATIFSWMQQRAGIQK